MTEWIGKERIIHFKLLSGGEANEYARAFLPSPIPSDVLKDILFEAQCAPSNCNTQPWSLDIEAGVKLPELSHALTEDL